MGATVFLWHRGRIIAKDNMQLKRKTVSAENAKIRLENLCARSEHCEWELREKLRLWQIGPGDAEEILASLRRARFYDDVRFAAAFVRDKLIYNRWGRRKIAMALSAKRISRDIAAEALDTIADKEYEEILLALMRGKARTIREGNTYEGRTKLYRSVASRGFETALISRFIRTEAIWPAQLEDAEDAGFNDME